MDQQIFLMGEPPAECKVIRKGSIRFSALRVTNGADKDVIRSSLNLGVHELIPIHRGAKTNASNLGSRGTVNDFK